MLFFFGFAPGSSPGGTGCPASTDSSQLSISAFHGLSFLGPGKSGVFFFVLSGCVDVGVGNKGVVSPGGPVCIPISDGTFGAFAEGGPSDDTGRGPEVPGGPLPGGPMPGGGSEVSTFEAGGAPEVGGASDVGGAP